MSEYQVIARKWRPQSFSDVVGQEHITSTLKNEINTGSHGVLIQTKASIIKEATGTERIKCSRGEKSQSKGGQRSARIPPNAPVRAAAKKPQRMRNIERAAACQNSGSIINILSDFSVCKGVGTSNSWFTIWLMSAQTRIHKTTLIRLFNHLGVFIVQSILLRRQANVMHRCGLNYIVPLSGRGPFLCA